MTAAYRRRYGGNQNARYDERHRHRPDDRTVYPDVYDRG